jgi:hypothetical protein
MTDEQESRPEVVAGPTSGRAPSRPAGDIAGAPDPRNQRQAPGQKGYGPGGPQIGSTDAPLTDVDVAALEETLGELKNLKESMEAADPPRVPRLKRTHVIGEWGSTNPD